MAITKINKILEINDSYKAPDRLMEILFDRSLRERKFNEFLDNYSRDLSYDWFNEYFQEEHADRKNKKQDFTPKDVANLINRLVLDSNGSDYYEVAVGTGTILIDHWHQQMMKSSPFNYYPSNYFHTVEEISDRAIPFLLFNMAIRGMNGVVLHVDTISRNCKGIFFLQNWHDDFLQFSDINVLPYTKEIAEYFNVNFIDVETKKSSVGYYPKHIERSWFDEDYMNYIESIINIKNAHQESMKKTQEDPNLTPEVKKLLNILGI